MENQARKTPEQRLAAANQKLEAARDRARKAEAVAAKMRAAVENKDRKQRAKENYILGAWLQTPEYSSIRLEIIGKLSRPQDRAVFGLENLEAQKQNVQQTGWEQNESNFNNF